MSRVGSLTRDIPAHVRRAVEHRDHHRCVVPGCRSSRRLHMHHIQDRAEGGPHVPENLCLLCRAHHGLLHRGKLQIVGRAPDLRITHAAGRPYGARQFKNRSSSSSCEGSIEGGGC